MKKIIVILLVAAFICADIYILAPGTVKKLSGWACGGFSSGSGAGSVSYLVVPSDGSDKASDGRPVIVLDPGHGGSDPGAVNKALGLKEAEINLRIARALADKLWNSGRVKVYLTREELGPKERKSLEQRVADAVSVNAELFISMHNNYDAKKSSGTEIYVSGRDTDASRGAYLLAEQMMSGFGAAGMRLRGIYCRMSENANTDAGGQLFDYYGVIRMCTDRGIPSMLVEHGFLNELDRDHIATPEAAETIAESEYHAIMRWFGFEPPEDKAYGSGDGDGSGLLDDADLELARKAVMCTPDSPAGDAFGRLDINGDRRVDSADVSYIFMMKNGIACLQGKNDKPMNHSFTADREDFKKGDKIKVTLELSGEGSLVSANGLIDFDQKSFEYAGTENVPENLVIDKDEEYGLVRWFLSPDGGRDYLGELPGNGADSISATFIFKMTEPREDNGYSINSAVYSASFYEADSAGLITRGGGTRCCDIRSVIIGKSESLQDEAG